MSGWKDAMITETAVEAPTKLQMQRERGGQQGTYRVRFSMGGHDFLEDFEPTIPDDMPAFGAVRLPIDFNAMNMKLGSSWNFDGRIEVMSVTTKGAAAKAGIFKGDLIRAVTTYGEAGQLFPWMRMSPPSGGIRLEQIDGRGWFGFSQVLEANTEIYGGDGTAVLVVERPFNRGDAGPGGPFDFFDGDGWGGGPDAGAFDRTPAWASGA